MNVADALEFVGDVADLAGPRISNQHGRTFALVLGLLSKGAARALRRGDTIEQIVKRIDMPPREVDVSSIEQEIADLRGGKKA